MKTKLILLCFALFIGCSSKQPNNSVNALDKKFTEFLNKFDSLKLPFNIISFDDIGEYIRDTTFEGIPNPHLKPIAGSELIFLKGKYIMDQTNQYSSINVV